MDRQPLQASFQAPDPAFISSLRFNEAGLIPAVAQDWLDGAVLMVAWMNQEAIERTLATGEVHYWSRSTSIFFACLRRCAQLTARRLLIQ